jgi:hypothetical protein
MQAAGVVADLAGTDGMSTRVRRAVGREMGISNQACSRMQLRSPGSLGSLEGEGCFSLMARRYPRVVATSPDLDVLVKLRTLARVGVVRSRARTGLGIERRWYCIVSRTREAIALMHGIRPVMGDRRGRMIDTVLERTLRLQSIGSGELSTSASLTCDSPPSVDFT